MVVEPSESLTRAALSVLERRYRLRVARISHLATHSNILFRVDTADGRRLVLRVSQPSANTRINLEIEVAWLSSLINDPELNIAEPIPTAEGHYITDLLADGHLRHCVLFTWVPGEPLGEGAGTSGYRAMGRLSALLHRHGDWRPPARLELRRWDKTFYYPVELEKVVVEDFRYDHLFTGLRPLLRRTAELGDYFISRRWEEEAPMVVHGDLHEWNVHLYMGRPWAIDFEDVMLALPSQDIATSLYGARTRPDLPAILEAFRAGYEEHRTWPVADPLELEIYWAARQVMLMNHAVQVLDEKQARGYFERIVPWLRGFMDKAAATTAG